MKKYGLAIAAFLLAILIGSGLVQASPEGTISIKRLHPAFQEHERLSSYQISPDEATVVYNAGDYTKNNYSLYAVPRRGTQAPVMISPPEHQGTVFDYAFTPDSQAVIYRHAKALLKVDLTGSGAQTITLPLSNTSPLVTESIGYFWIGPDQQSLIYEILTYPSVYTKLMRVDLDDSATTELVSSPSRIAVEAVTSSAVVYRDDPYPQAPHSSHLFSVPVQGGARIALTSALTTTQYVRELAQISPDEQTVIFRVGSTNNSSVYTVYEAALDGSSMVRLSDPAHTRVWWPLPVLSPDSQRILYLNEVSSYETHLYSVPRGGGPATRLDGPEVLSAGTPVVTLDSQRVVFAGAVPNGPGTSSRLYSVPIAGGSPTPLADKIGRFVVAQDSRTVLYVTVNEELDTVLYKVGISGGPATEIKQWVEDGSSSYVGRLKELKAPAWSNEVFAIHHDQQHERDTAYTIDVQHGMVKQLNPAPFTDLFIQEDESTVTKSGDVIIVGSGGLLVSIRDDKPIPVFLPLIQR
jgi:hypothetical protein